YADQVRPARLRAQPTRRLAWQRHWRFGDHARAIRDAGMFADSGAPPPPGLGTGTPQQVGNAVVRAVEHDKSEISVAPLRQRALARFAMMAPEISVRLAGSAATKAADAIASVQTDKR